MQRQSYESLSEQLDEAHEQALYAANDARLWEEAYSQTVNADLERENGELLFSNKQLEENVARATRCGAYRLLVPKNLSVHARLFCLLSSLRPEAAGNMSF